MQKVRMILVGGFLGAGKTTLLMEAARRLAEGGRRVGLITNDQAPNLVDTRLLAGRGLDVREVAGSCFCCNFDGLVESAESLRGDAGADVILAEPVGSCTDLSATIVQPLKDKYSENCSTSPLSVAIDPYRLNQLRTGLTGTLHPSAVYIIRKQLEEADAIVITKVDQLSVSSRAKIGDWLGRTFTERPVFWLSSKSGEGVEGWLAFALEGNEAGQRIPEVDYDTYAEGEAVLGWLNATARVEPAELAAGELCTTLLTTLRDELAESGAAIGHIKLIAFAPGGTTVANLVQTDGEIVVREYGASESAVPGTMTLNLRVQMPPEDLEALCRRTIDASSDADVHVTLDDVRSLSPGRPEPTHRYSRVVGAG